MRTPMPARGLWWISGACLLVLALDPVPAGAATEFGGADMSKTPTLVNTPPKALITVTTPTGAPPNAAPVSGVLVSVRTRTKGAAGSGVVRVLRQTGMPFVTDYSILNSGPEIPLSVTADAAPQGHVTEVPTRRPIIAGDRLSWYTGTAGITNTYVDATGQCAFLTAGALHTPGTTELYSTTNCNMNITLLSGTIEPDADGDGFGDETQDRCATDATAQGACPVAKTVAKKKCKKGFRLEKVKTKKGKRKKKCVRKKKSKRK
jgi:hypothetical protein